MAQKKQKLKFKQEKFITQRYSERTKLWTFQVYFRYTDFDGQQATYTSSFSEKDFLSAKSAYLAAIADRDEKRNMLNTVGLPKNEDHSVREMLELFLDMSTLSFETKRKKRITFNKYTPAAIQEMGIKKIKASDIQKQFSKNVEDGATKGILTDLMTIWKQIYRAAMMKDIVSSDQSIKLTMPITHKPIIKKDVTTDSETIQKVCEAIMKHSRNSDSSLFDAQIISYAIQLQWYTGIRPAECFALEKSHIDFDKGVLHIHQSLGSTARNSCTVRDTKTALSYRDIPITASCKSLLKEIIDFQDNDFLFADFNGSLMNSTKVSNKIRLACKAEEIEFNMYRCRHQFSTDLILSGQDVRTVMELMGHNNIGMTIEYARSNNNSKLNALENRNK